MSLAGEVRKILQEGPADLKTLAQRLDLAKVDRAGSNRLTSTLVDLKAAGMVTWKIRPGKPALYHLAGRTSLPGEVQARMARVVRLRGGKNRPITCTEVAVLSGCTQEYAARYLRFLKNDGYLLEGTAVKLSRFGLGLAYRVAPGREKEKPPWWNRRAEEARKKVGQASPPATPLAAGGTPALLPDELQKFAGNMRQAFADFSAGLRQALAPYFPQVEPVLLEMEADLVKIAEEQGHDEPEKPTAGHH